MKSISLVNVIGLGYIGLPTALLIAESGVAVHGVDVDVKKVNSLKADRLYFSEPGLMDLFLKAKNNFSVSEKPQAADVHLIAVPTPQNQGKVDLKYVISALESLRDYVKNGDLIIVESTIGPLDCREKIAPMIQAWNKRIYFAHCPERAIPGTTIHEMIFNDRIIGAQDRNAKKKCLELYKRFVKGSLLITDPTTAAISKLMENTYRSVNIALANEFAQLVEDLHCDVWEAISLANRHPRVSIHSPGPGVGGHCIPIDPWFFVEHSEKSNLLIEHALKINDEMPSYIVHRAIQLADEHLTKKPVFGVLGLSYKKNVDDMRESPAFPIIKLLEKQGKVLCSDPHVKNTISEPLENVLQRANSIIVVTDHDIFKSIKFKKYQNIQVIFDTRNCISHTQLKDTNIKLFKLGSDRQ